MAEMMDTVEATKRRILTSRAMRRAFAFAVTLIVIASFAAVAGRAVAGPGGVPAPVTGLTSSTHPSEITWYNSTNPGFAWDPVNETNSAIAGYSIALDQNVATVPDTTTDRQSLDFLARTVHTAGSNPAENRVAEVNGDGRQDIVVENYNSNTVSVFIGRGDGTFAAKVDYATGNGPWSLALTDVNGDGKPDIVTGNLNASTASVLLGRGDGTFADKVDYPTGSAPECLRVGDVNGDAKPDIVSTNSTANTVSVLLGRGDGTFGAKTDFATSGHPTSIDLGDLNGDGKIDLVTANTTPNNVSVLMGNGDGTFRAKVDYGTGNSPYTVIVADVNGDAKLDIETVNYGASSASVLLNKGDGTFNAKVDYATGSGPYALAVADLNHDGAPDLVTTNHNADSVSILFGNGDGTFISKTDRVCGTGPFWVALGDFNGDGYGDLATTDETAGTMSVLVGTAFLAANYSGKPDGVWYFHVRAVDALGVGGPTTTRAVRIDTTAPITTQSGADALWHAADVTVGLSGTDANSGVASTEYRIDGGGWVSGTTVTVPAPSDGSNDGIHTIGYRSTDAVGHVEGAKSCSVKIVTVAPTTSAGAIDSAWHASDVALTFSSGSAGDPVIEYRIDGGGWVTGTATVIPATPDGSNDGAHTVEYRATNALGMVEAAKSATVKIDVAAPTTSVSGADSLWHGGDVTLGFTADDAGSAVAKSEYRIDGGGWVELTGSSLVVPAPADGSNDGVHTIDYRSTDTFGHVESANSATVKIDGGAPTTTQSGADALWHAADVTVTFSGTDAASGVTSTEYRLDGGDWTSGTTVTAPAPSNGSNDGVHTLQYRSTDAVGHVESANSATVNIDTGAPVTTTPETGVWHAAPYTLTLTPTDSGSGMVGGLASTQYSLDGGANWSTGTQLIFPRWKRSGGSGLFTVLYRSTDSVGYVEAPKSVEVKIDSERPRTSSDAPKAPQTGDVDVTLTGDDPLSGIKESWYSVNGDPWSLGSSVLIPASSVGINTIRYFSIDNAGNKEAGYRVSQVTIAP